MSDRYTAMLLGRIDRLKASLLRERNAKYRQRDRAELWKQRALAKAKRKAAV